MKLVVFVGEMISLDVLLPIVVVILEKNNNNNFEWLKLRFEHVKDTD